MFARNISIHLKPNTLADFTETFEKEVVPVLRKQKGFQDEITFAMPGGTDVIAISLWDSAADMQAYEQGDLYRKEFAPALQPFFVGDYKTYRCDVKYQQ